MDRCAEAPEGSVFLDKNSPCYNCFPAAQHCFELVVGFLSWLAFVRATCARGDFSSCLSLSAVPQQSLAQFAYVTSEHFLSIDGGCSPGTSKIHRAAEPELDAKSLAFLGIPTPPDAARRPVVRPILLALLPPENRAGTAREVPRGHRRGFVRAKRQRTANSEPG